MRRSSVVSTGVVLWVLMMSQQVLATSGTLFTPGQIVINPGHTAVVRVSNHRSVPIVNVVVLAVGPKDVIEFQHTILIIRPHQTADVILPPPRDLLDWQPVAFVPAAEGKDNIFFDLFTEQGAFGQATFSDPPTAQYPNKLWRAVPESEFTSPDILKYGDLPHVSSRTFGPINAGPPQPGDAVFVKNLGTEPVKAFVYCLDGYGQKVRGCGGVNVIQPHEYAAVFGVQVPKRVFLVLCADKDANLLWANLLIGSTDYPNEVWEAHEGPDFCAGQAPPGDAPLSRP